MSKELQDIWEQLSPLREQSTRLHVESEKLREKSVRLWAESEKLRREHGRRWALAVIENYNNNVEFRWQFISVERGYRCIFQGGEVYEP